MYKQFDFRFRYQVSEKSPHATLFKYLSSKETEFPLHQMMAWALSAFWYPLAWRWSKQYSEAELRAIACKAIQELQAQINYLVQAFNLEQELAAPAMSARVRTNSNGTSHTAERPTSTDATNGFSGNGAPDPTTDVQESIHGSDDDVLDQIFNN